MRLLGQRSTSPARDRWFSAITVDPARSSVGREYLQFNMIASGMVRDKAIRYPGRAGVEEQQFRLFADCLKTVWCAARHADALQRADDCQTAFGAYEAHPSRKHEIELIIAIVCVETLQRARVEDVDAGFNQASPSEGHESAPKPNLNSAPQKVSIFQ